jgi:hypothetical protein
MSTAPSSKPTSTIVSVQLRQVDLPPKVVAAAMGHSVQTHLAAYSRWCGDDVVDDAFAKAEQRFLAA